MNRFLGVTLTAVVLTIAAAHSAQAGYCGAASFKLCSCNCETSYAGARRTATRS